MNPKSPAGGPSGPLPGQPFDPNEPQPQPGKRWMAILCASAVLLAALALGRIGQNNRAPAPMVPEPAATAESSGTVTSPTPGGPSPSATAMTNPAVFSPTPAGKMVEVHVAGQVFNPGVYSLPSTARVQDAIEKAGGARPEANLDAINLADWVHDGGKILVPAKGQAAPAGGDTSAGAGDGGAATPSGPVNLNTASEADLDALPGIGPKMAEKILQYRTDHGGFKSVADLQNVPGIGSRKFEAVKGLVTVE